MTNQEFCTYIQTQDCFIKLIKDYKPQLVFLAGSRGVGTNLPTSDYDLVAITFRHKIKSSFGYDDVFLTKIQNQGVHCYVYSIDFCMSWLNQDGRYNTPIVSDLMFQNIIALQNPDNIIIKTGSYEYDFWFENKKQIIKNSMQQLILKHGDHQQTNLKFLGHCILCFSLLIEKTIPIDFICRLKQQKYSNTNLYSTSMIWKEIKKRWDEFIIQPE